MATVKKTAEQRKADRLAKVSKETEAFLKREKEIVRPCDRVSMLLEIEHNSHNLVGLAKTVSIWHKYNPTKTDWVVLKYFEDGVAQYEYTNGEVTKNGFDSAKEALLGLTLVTDGVLPPFKQQ